MQLAPHVSGYARKIVSMTGNALTAKVMYVTRRMHQHASMVNIGMRARPAPRITAETLWANASAKKKKHSVRICDTPMATTAGSLLNILMTYGHMK